MSDRYRARSNPNSSQIPVTQLPAFRQPPCPQSSIRLFRIESLHYMTTPRLHLEVFSFSDCPPYIAISYTWTPQPRTLLVTGYGPGYPTSIPNTGRPFQNTVNPNPKVIGMDKEIQINEGQYTITLHLIGALWALQRHQNRNQDFQPTLTPSQTPVWIFVDAICIRQDDSTDKEIQVGNMHQIFRQAASVFVWLGQGNYGKLGGESQRIGLCFPEVDNILKELEPYIQSFAEPKQSVAAGERTSTALPPRLPYDDKQLWECFGFFQYVPWFERLWVVQEAALAQDVMMMCGRYSLHWSQYSKLMRLCHTLKYQLSFINMPSRLRDRIDEIFNHRVLLIGLLGELITQDGSVDMPSHTEHEIVVMVYTLIDVVRLSFVTEPLDRLYAVLAFFGDRIRQNIRVDYSEDTKSNYWLKWVKVWQTIVALKPLLATSLFAHASYLKQRDGMPSWCPNLEDNSHCPQIMAMHYYPKAGIFTESTHRTQDETIKYNKPRIFPLPRSQSLRVVGSRVDQVRNVVDLSWMDDALHGDISMIGFNGEMPSSIASDILDTISKCLRVLQEANPEAALDEVTLARCLIGNTYRLDRSSTETFLQDYQAYKSWLTDISNGNTSQDTLSESVEHLTPEYGVHFQRVAMRSAFIVTEQGRPGLTSYKVKPGDFVCVFFGLGMPYTLHRRRGPKSFELVGETHLDGIMDGEALIDRDLDVEPGESFDIY